MQLQNQNTQLLPTEQQSSSHKTGIQKQNSGHSIPQQKQIQRLSSKNCVPQSPGQFQSPGKGSILSPASKESQTLQQITPKESISTVFQSQQTLGVVKPVQGLRYASTLHPMKKSNVQNDVRRGSVQLNQLNFNRKPPSSSNSPRLAMKKNPTVTSNQSTVTKQYGNSDSHRQHQQAAVTTPDESREGGDKNGMVELIFYNSAGKQQIVKLSGQQGQRLGKGFREAVERRNEQARQKMKPEADRSIVDNVAYNAVRNKAREEFYKKLREDQLANNLMNVLKKNLSGQNTKIELQFILDQVCPVPQDKSILNKFNYFYAPYNYTVNTQKHMHFSDPSFNNDMRVSRSVDQMIKAQTVEEPWTKDPFYEIKPQRFTSEPPGWKSLYRFIYKQDERVKSFVYNQILQNFDSFHKRVRPSVGKKKHRKQRQSFESATAQRLQKMGKNRRNRGKSVPDPDLTNISTKMRVVIKRQIFYFF